MACVFNLTWFLRLIVPIMKSLSLQFWNVVNIDVIRLLNLMRSVAWEFSIIIIIINKPYCAKRSGEFTPKIKYKSLDDYFIKPAVSLLLVIRAFSNTVTYWAHMVREHVWVDSTVKRPGWKQWTNCTSQPLALPSRFPYKIMPVHYFFLEVTEKNMS